MIDMKRFGLNRIVAPSLSLAAFYDLAVSVGIAKVELRNDIGGKDPIDGMKPSEALALAKARGIEVATINALQKFNLASARSPASKELDALLELASAIGCKAIVLCPNNDAADKRSAAQRLSETVDSLVAFGPRFEKAGVLGYVEPLGFGISSLASLVVAQEAIRKSGFSCYRIVHDTFHHHIGPDDLAILGKSYSIANTGLVHISGVESDIPTSEYRDAHRVLVGPGDRMKNKEQLVTLEKLGYTGLYSFEPFSPAVQKLDAKALAAALKKSLEYLRS
jgi:2-keto-myo-inositol isomerase